MAVVYDALVGLHALAIPARKEEEPAEISLERVVSFIASKCAGAKHAAFCFDNAAETPISKHVELGKRSRSDVRVSPDELTAMLDTGVITNMHSVILSRGARELLCERIAQGLLSNHQEFDTLFVFGCGTPRERVGGVIRERPDLAQTMHGEADIACVYASHILRKATSSTAGPGPRVEIRTVDTDLVAIAMLSAHSNMHVSLSYQSTVLNVDICALREAMCAQYNLNVHELVLALFSRGTDYVERSITFLADWHDYMTRLAAGMRRSQAPLASAAGVDLGRLHEAMVSASASKPRSKLKFTPHDGHLLRLAWQLMYSARAPLYGGAGLDPTLFGWAVRDGQTVRVPSQRWGIVV
jgi:hypothetical protein